MEKRTRSAEKSEGVGAISLCFCLKGERGNVKGCGERERRREVKGWFFGEGCEERRERERGEREEKKKKKKIWAGPRSGIFLVVRPHKIFVRSHEFLIFRFFCNFVVLIQTCIRAVAQRKNAAAQTCVLPKFEL